MKRLRTRPIRGDYFLTVPRVAIHGRIYEIKCKVSKVILTDVGGVKGYPPPCCRDKECPHYRDYLGEIERGSIDSDEASPGGVQVPPSCVMSGKGRV